MTKLGIIGAMQVEVETLLGEMTNQRTTRKAGSDFYEGTLEGLPVVVVQCGVGKVNAALCVQILCDCFQVTHIVNTGVAGSLCNDINIGDIVISTNALQHDVDATGFGYERGVIPQMDKSCFEADKELIEVAKNACEKVNPDIQVFTGRIVSGDQFISKDEVKQDLVDTFQGLCTEMEGGAMAQVAWLNQVPFVVIRAISDKADHSAEVDYAEFEQKAIEHSVKLVCQMLTDLA